MRYALINPPWSFDGSIYFGCREPHLPLEYGYAKALLERAGHEVLLLDAQLDELSLRDLHAAVAVFKPDFSVITTAPSYLFWRCAPPELRVPQQTAAALRDVGGRLVVVGPHGSTTPRATLRKLGADLVVMGECEEILPELAARPWPELTSVCYADSAGVHVQGAPHASDMASLPALRWPASVLRRHHHHHHRFDRGPQGPGAEMEASRGCPYRCTFCAKENFRSRYRKRPLAVILEELDGLIAEGVEYVYFIDEIFLPDRELLEALAARAIRFGVQLRIDRWSFELLDLLGRAGCVSIEAGVESISEEGRRRLDKHCKLSTDELSERLIHARRTVPFVQANLLEAQTDAPEAIAAFRSRLKAHGIWANEPVPLFPYPGSPDYTLLWGPPDDLAWERAHAHYLERYRQFSDIQAAQPEPLAALELGAANER
jgi:anaerobic magnesium-protoporphyrin IX monomethyl ester cyclase